MTSDSSESHSITSYITRYFNRLFRVSKFRKNPMHFDPAQFTNLEISKQEMIKGIIGLSSKNARDIMIPRIDIISLDSNTQLKELIAIVSEAGHSRIPVFEDTIDNIIGILYVKDLLKFVLEKPRKFSLKKMLHKTYFVPETMTLDDLLLEFKKRKLHLAVTVDEYGGVGGIVTLEDVLEEIVGEIVDEFDEYKEPELQKINKNVYEVDSRITIPEINEELNLMLPSNDFDTIGGLVFDLFGKIPKKDEVVRFNDISFKIKDIQGTRINRIILTLHGHKENS